MAAQTSTGGIEFQFKARDFRTSTPRSDKNFNLLILGAFSGDLERSKLAPLHQRPRLIVDRDNLDEVLARLKPTINIAREGQGVVKLSFSSLDDFHPDHLYERLPFFKDLQALRRGLQSDSGFARAAEELEVLLNLKPAPIANPSSPASTQPSTATPAPDGLLDAILSDEAGASDAAADQWLNKLVDAATTPYTLPAKDPRKDDYLLLIDATLSHLMTSILHHPTFQRLEAVWRDVEFLVRRLETDSQLKLTLVDISQEELFADLADNNPVENSQFNRLLTDSGASDQEPPWRAVLALQSFLPAKVDAIMLGLIAKLCAQAQTPFLADADSMLAQAASFFLHGDPEDWQLEWPADFNHTWTQIRAMPATAYIALAAPRILLRAPYSDSGRSIEHFRYEELSGELAAEQLLWGHGCVVMAAVLAQQFSEQGNISAQQSALLERLSLAYYRDPDAGEMLPIPCAESYLTQRGFDTLREQGINPIIALRNRDAIKIQGVYSLCQDGQPLAIC